MSEKITVDSIISHIDSGLIPTIEEIKWVNEKSKIIFERLPNVIRIKPPVTLCGDIHGQFKDLRELFRISGDIPYTSYLFMGDYVDRGSQSIEVVTYLFCLKIKYPEHITLLRGNHESVSLSQIFGFRDEVLSRYGSDEIWKIYTETFNYLPLAALVGEKILCVHGGLSPSLKNIEEIEKLDRFREIPHDGPLCDILWSDPSQRSGFQESCREAGYQFGPNISYNWNKENGLELTARAHQLVMSGLEYTHNNQIVTIFSAPNYCGRCRNKAGIMEVDEEMRRKEIHFDTPKNKNEGKDQIPDYFDYDLPLD